MTVNDLIAKLPPTGLATVSYTHLREIGGARNSGWGGITVAAMGKIKSAGRWRFTGSSEPWRRD